MSGRKDGIKGKRREDKVRRVHLCYPAHIRALLRVNFVLLDEVIHEDSMAVSAGKMEGSPATIRLYV